MTKIDLSRFSDCIVNNSMTLNFTDKNVTVMELIDLFHTSMKSDNYLKIFIDMCYIGQLDGHGLLMPDGFLSIVYFPLYKNVKYMRLEYKNDEVIANIFMNDNIKED